jgi:hypothetical protein
MVMDIRIFDLPTRHDRPEVIERRLAELERRAQHGENLDEVEIDWMDTANTWLLVEMGLIPAT